MHFDNARQRFGSAGFADARDIAAARLTQKRGLYMGHDFATGQALYSDDESAVLVCGGARSGKGSLIVPMLIDGAIGDTSIVSMDWKGQNGAIAAQQVRHDRRSIQFNPRGRPGPAHRINPLSHLTADSLALDSDAAQLFENLVTSQDEGAKDGYFVDNGRRIGVAVTKFIVHLTGSVSLPVLGEVLADMTAGSERWLRIEAQMLDSDDLSIRIAAQDIAAMRRDGNDTAGWGAIQRTLTNAFAFLNDRALMGSISPPYDFCFSELIRPGAPPYLVSIMEAFENRKAAAPVVKALYACARAWKSRAVGARKVVFLLDEIGNVGAWPMVAELCTYGAGAYKTRTVIVVQATAQIDKLAPSARREILNSAGTQIYLGVRDYAQAKEVSERIGTQTLEFDDLPSQERARQALREAEWSVLHGGADPVEAMLGVRHQQRLATAKTKQARLLRTPEEIMHEPPGRAFVFKSGLARPIYAHVPPYWRRRDLAGAYLPDPYHARSCGGVEIASWRGQRVARVITEAVPPAYADWPQYRDSGTWSYVEGFRP